MKRIISPDNSTFKSLKRLASFSRERRKQGKCLLEGWHLLESYRSRYGAPELVLLTERAASFKKNALLDSNTVLISERLFGELSQVTTPVGVLAVINTPQPANHKPGNFCLLLEGIQDPGNLGTILRTAASVGCKQIYLSQDSVFAWSPKTLRAGQGAHFFLDIFEGIDLASFIKNYHGRVLAAVATGGQSLFEVDLSGAVALLIGNEGAGLSTELLNTIQEKITIPMPGAALSLNAAVAAALCLYEKLRG